MSLQYYPQADPWHDGKDPIDEPQRGSAAACLILALAFLVGLILGFAAGRLL